jgi:hypothetical protein
MTAFKFTDAALSQHIAIVGKTGSGKTYTAKGLVETMLGNGRRVCILDPTGVWWGLKSTADGQRAGFPVAIFGGMHADVPIAEGSGEALAKIIATKNLPAIVDLSEMLIGQRQRFATDFAEALYRHNHTPLHLVIDEADEFMPQNPLPESRRMLHHFDRIVRRGRVRGFRVVLITQRPAVLHKNVLTQANALVALRLTAPQDRAALQAWVEGNADAAKAKEVIGSLAGLQRGHGWVWAPEAGILERATFPPITTFDSGRTPEDGDEIAEPTILAAVDLAEVQASLLEVEPKEEELGAKDLRAELTRQRRRVLELEDQAAQPRAPTVSEALRAAVATIAAALQVVQEQLESAGPAGATQPQPAPAPRQRDTTPARAPRERDVTAAPAPVASGLSGSQQRILDSLAALEAFGVPTPAKETLAAHAGATNTSSGYRNNLSVLRTGGLIEYPIPGAAMLTEAGRRAANAPTRKLTLRDLHEAWLRLLSGSQAAILSNLIEAYPKSVGKAALAEMVSAIATSSGYRNNLSRLRTMGAIDYPQSGMARAADILFPKGGK